MQNIANLNINYYAVFSVLGLMCCALMIIFAALHVIESTKGRKETGYENMMILAGMAAVVMLLLSIIDSHGESSSQTRDSSDLFGENIFDKQCINGYLYDVLTDGMLKPVYNYLPSDDNALLPGQLVRCKVTYSINAQTK
ncbi:TPA: hypothetical protein N2P55_003606 [Escherichia coli]|nr:hypothetical protein [Escherichia coli]HCL6287067.1 hypothetical protein [Escherichia coli]